MIKQSLGKALFTRFVGANRYAGQGIVARRAETRSYRAPKAAGD